MPVTSWAVTNIGGTDYLVIDVAKFRVPLDWDPTSGMFIAVAVPDGGVGSLPILAKGDPGDTPTLTVPINLIALAAEDPTPDSATWTEIGTDNYQMNLTLHKGPKGDDGTTTLDLSAYGTPVAGSLLVVNTTADGLLYQPPPFDIRGVPAVLNSAPTGNPTYTLGTIAFGPQTRDYRIFVTGQTVFAPTAGDVAVDLLVRLNNETSGAIIGRGIGVAGLNIFGITSTIPATHLEAGPPPGSPDSYDKVLAGASATIYLRAERTAGSGTFTTAAATTTFTGWARSI